ncbi:glycosyltransferase [Flavobacterium enshiense]|uniref:glycosyltransferase n=1 Tax=Flavobacterium enshiense TaxID=1341165 RepID=UPI00345C73C6
MKIVYLIDTLEIGGAERSLVDIATRSSLFDAVFITLYKGNTLESVLKGNNIKVYALNLPGKYAFAEAVKKIIPILKEVQPDLIHSTLFKADIVSRRIKKKYPVPLINSFVNNSYVKDRYAKLNAFNKLKLYLFQCYDSITSGAVDFFISNSETIKINNAKALHVNPDKIKVIYRGRNIETFASVPTEKIDELDHSLGLKNKMVFLNVSRLLERKGQLDLLLAFAKIKAHNSQAVLLIAGEGNYKNVLEAKIRELNLESSCILLGNRNDIPVLLQRADFFVFPSYYEGLPGALIEAMMSRKKIICSDIPENKECVSEKSALIFRKGDVNHLAEKMQFALENNASVYSMPEAAYQEALLKFDIESVIRQYALTYEHVVANYKK